MKKEMVNKTKIDNASIVFFPMANVLMSNTNNKVEMDESRETLREHGHLHEHGSEIRNFKMAAMESICKSLEKKGMSYTRGRVQDAIPYQLIWMETSGNRGYKPDMVLYVSEDKVLEWWFDFRHFSEKMPDQRHFNITRYLGKFMLQDADHMRKVTIVVSDEDIYDKLASYRGHIPYRGNLSVMLIDSQDYSVRREVYLAHYNENEKYSEFFAK